jgi:hypothetical protein
MVLKRKTISRIATRKAVKHSTEDAEVEDEMQLVSVEKIMKKPAGSREKIELDSDEENDEAEDGEDEEAEEIDPEKLLAQKEDEIKTERTKELKSMYMDELKKVVVESGLATGTKEIMIKSLLKHEAKSRAETRAHEAKIRNVVVKKKEELENTPLADLGKLCESIGVKGLKGKPERVKQLLLHWQKNDGVEKALTEIALNERKGELKEMDNDSLRKLCDKAGLDPFVKEVMVDRISKKEQECGRYLRAAPTKETTKALQDVDMVDALLANESNRKKEKEKEDAIATQKKALRSMGVDELKKALTAKGLEANGKKDEMVEALFAANLREEAAAQRKSTLKKMAPHDLKALLSSYGLEAASKDKMVDAIIAQEAKRNEELKLFDAKLDEVAEKKKEVLQKKSNADLKNLCQKNGLAVGGGKEEKVERLVEEVRSDGSLEKEVSVIIRGSRKDELMKLEKEEIQKLCERMEVDPYLKDVMIERIVAYESEVDEPVTKKLRKK